jgi:hypothetical protein
MSRVLSLSALSLVSAATVACAPSFRTPVSVTRFDDTVVYFGPLTSAGLETLKRADGGSARSLLIRSGGGSVTVGMDFGDWFTSEGWT